MTKDKALKLALEALEQIARLTGPRWALENGYASHLQAIVDLREALAQPQPAQQEPVAWGVFESNLHDMFFTEAEAVEMAQLKGTHAEVKPLYTKENT